MFFQDLLKQHTAVLHTSDNRAVVCFPLVWTLPLLLQGASILPPFSQGERERESYRFLQSSSIYFDCAFKAVRCPTSRFDVFAA